MAPTHRTPRIWPAVSAALLLGCSACNLILGPPAKTTTALHIKAIEANLAGYFANTGTYPITPADQKGCGLGLSDTAQDGWGKPFRYKAYGAGATRFRLESLGADGKVGGEGDDADWLIEYRGATRGRVVIPE